MIAFRFRGTAYFIAIAGESALGAFHVWKILGRKYKVIGESAVPNFVDDVPKIKRLVETELLTDTEYYVLQTTFENKIIPSSMFGIVADALEAFEPSTSNLVRQAQILRCAIDQGVRAMAFIQFMVGDNIWYNHKENRPYNLDYDDWHSVLVERERSPQPDQ